MIHLGITGNNINREIKRQIEARMNAQLQQAQEMEVMQNEMSVVPSGNEDIQDQIPYGE